ncbi:ImmA/IrrE family metallo-endopeptidase [Corynebacterium sp. DNF00584]|uniref:ImmA/IrrE family metallo-endopeptidase n=1 Tax=Corynebacterium sp. DNF00584 TaxID=1384076 RepID=UPI0007994ECB|nr:ImmA/IrrE family metallo-endopeptidase [Corynebacterium sp. DNF00584]KXB52761.1 hypothetical protein HMPREF0307_02079 [Corynebacterium sp. DNF00584]
MSFVEDRLADMLAGLNVRLVESSKLDPQYNAVWHPASRTVIVRRDLDPVTRTCAIAHELGHIVNGDTCSSPRAERLADEWAALQLIEADRVEDVAADCDGVPTAVAAELGVTPHLLGVWMQLFAAGRVSTMSCMIL